MPVTDLDDPAVASSGTRIEEADVAIAARLGEQRHDPVVRAVGALSEIADQAPSFVACGLVLVAGLATGRPRLAEAGTRMLASVLLATALKSTVKKLVSRTRPRALIEKGGYDFRPLGQDGGDQHSFPSGHTAGAVAAARGCARTFPDTAMPAYATAAAIALVQIPRAKHYPLDLAAGALVGLASEAVVAGAIDALRGQSERHRRGCEGEVGHGRSTRVAALRRGAERDL